MKRTSSFGISSRRSYRFSWNHSTSASSELVVVLQEGGPLPWSKTGLLSNTQKWTVHRDTCVMKQRILLGKDSWVENRRVRVPRRTALPCGSHAFYGDGISFPVVFSLSFWLRVLPGGANGGVSRSAKMDAGEKDSGRWSDMWCHFLTCLRTLPVGVGLLVPCTVPGSPVIKQLMKLLLWCLARVGGFSQCASPNNSPLRDIILKILLGNWGRGLFLL